MSVIDMSIQMRNGAEAQLAAWMLAREGPFMVALVMTAMVVSLCQAKRRLPTLIGASFAFESRRRGRRNPQEAELESAPERGQQADLEMSQGTDQKRMDLVMGFVKGPAAGRAVAATGRCSAHRHRMVEREREMQYTASVLCQGCALSMRQWRSRASRSPK